jgi:hypothetical protein
LSSRKKLKKFFCDKKNVRRRGGRKILWEKKNYGPLFILPPLDCAGVQCCQMVATFWQEP